MGLFNVVSAFEQDALLLDQYPTASAAWSVRKLRTEYTGAALRVRRSNDNATQDIGFVNNALDTTQIRSFVGSNSAFVDIWYDQSGRGFNLTMPSSSAQPRIVNSGLIESSSISNPLPTLAFDGTDFMTGSQFITGSANASCFYVFSSTTAAAADTNSFFWYTSGLESNNAFFKGSQAGALAAERMTYGLSKQPTINGGRLGSTTYARAANTMFVESDFWLSSGMRGFQNNTEITLNVNANGFTTGVNASPANVAPVTNLFALCAFINVGLTFAFGPGGKVSEVIWWGDNKINERIDINNNINQYYNIF